MPLSLRFKAMRKRLGELRKTMLPQNFSPTADYTNRQLDRTAGYRVLVHAEIESYLEEIAKECVITAIRNWKLNKSPSNVLVAFLASYHSSWNEAYDKNEHEIIKISKSRVNIKDKVDEVIDVAQRQYFKRLKDNHGIKEVNFKKLMIPLGIEVQELDQTWLAGLDTFGSNRGDVAHNSLRTVGNINPKDEYDSVVNLIKGLKDLDVIVSNLN